jgi:hypothetical protein
VNVLFVQLFPRQFEWLTQKYVGPHQLDFLDSSKDESVTRLKDKAARADKVVVLSKFISHSKYDKNVLPREKVIYCDSVNLERMLDVLDTLPANDDEKKPEKAAKVHTKRLAPVPAVEEERPMSTTTTRTVDGFVLTTAVPYPGEKRKAKYPFEVMKVGESFFVECPEKERGKTQQNLSAAANYFIKSQQPEWRFKTSVKEKGGVRIWRMPDKKEAKH